MLFYKKAEIFLYLFIDNTMVRNVILKITFSNKKLVKVKAYMCLLEREGGGAEKMERKKLTNTTNL